MVALLCYINIVKPVGESSLRVKMKEEKGGKKESIVVSIVQQFFQKKKWSEEKKGYRSIENQKRVKC